MLKQTICTVFLALLFVVVTSRKQGVTIKGKLRCNGLPLLDAKVKLFDIDRFPGDADDLMDEGVTSATGQFILEGYHEEMSDIEPELRIYHRCNYATKDCKRRVIKPIPFDYVYEYDAKQKTFNLGTMDVAVPFENEIESCDDDEFL